MQQTAHYLIQTHLERRYGIAPAFEAGHYVVGPMRRKDPGDGPFHQAKRPRFGRLAGRYDPADATPGSTIRPNVIKPSPQKNECENPCKGLTQIHDMKCPVAALKVVRCPSRLASRANKVCWRILDTHHGRQHLHIEVASWNGLCSIGSGSPLYCRAWCQSP